MLTVLMMTAAMTLQGDARVLVANLSSSSVSEYNAETGEFLGHRVAPESAGLLRATGVIVGPSGDIFVGSSGSNLIARYSSTGDPVATVGEWESLTRPFSILLHEGRLLVSSENTVLAYTTGGEFIDTIARGPELTTPIGLRIGPDGLLYVANAGGHNVLRYDPDGGGLIDVFVADSTLRFPSDIVFGRDGVAYVSSAFNASVAAVSDGVVVRTIPLPEGAAPVGLALDSQDRLYISDFARSRLLRTAPGPSLPVEVLATEGLAGPENLTLTGQ